MLRERLVGGFKALARLAILYPKRVLGVVALITLGTAAGVAWLSLRTDGRALVRQKAPEVVFDQAIREQFGIADNFVVLIRSSHADGIFNTGTVHLVRDLTLEFGRLPGTTPADVVSLATEPSFRMRPGTLVNQTLLEPPLTTKAELDQVREDISRIGLYTGTLISADGKCTVILIGAPGRADRPRLYQAVQQVLAQKQSVAEEIAVTGAPVAESLLGTHILEDLGVPRALLGTSTRPPGHTAWKAPGGVYGLRLLIARRIGLVPVVILVMTLVLFASFRNVLATFLPMPGLLATLLFVFGLMGWLGVPVYLTMAVMPVLLTATGVTNDIYVFSRYLTLLRERPQSDCATLLFETFDKMAAPIAGTSLTTGIGFLSFGFSPLGPVRAFGVCTGIGVLFGLLYSFTAVPAMLRLIDPAWLRPRPGAGRSTVLARLAAWFGRLGPVVVRQWRWVAGLTLVIVALTPLGLRRLAVQDSWIDGFDPESEFRRATSLVNEQFHGMHLLLVSADAPSILTGEVMSPDLSAGSLILPGNLVEDPGMIAGSTITLSTLDKSPAGGVSNSAPGSVWRSHIEMATREGNQIFTRIPPGNMPPDFWQEFYKARHARFDIAVHTQLRPEIIRALSDLAAFIRERRAYAVGGVLGPAEFLTTTRFMVRSSDPEARRLPADASEAKLLWDYYGLARGRQRLRQIMDTNYWRSLTTVFLKDANFVDTAKLMGDIRTYEREHLAPLGIKLGFAGDVALSQSLIQGIVATQLQSLFWSVVGISVITAALGGSLRWGLYCVLPSVLAVVIKLAVMGWAGIPLGVATSMFAAMTLGIGVNCAIQLLESYTQAQAEGASSLGALSQSLSATGPPALINTLAMSLGFGVLMLSQVPANVRLGLLVVLGLVECFIVSLLLLPVLLNRWPLKKSLGV